MAVLGHDWYSFQVPQVARPLFVYEVLDERTRIARGQHVEDGCLCDHRVDRGCNFC